MSSVDRFALMRVVLAAALLAGVVAPVEAQLQDQTRVAPTNDLPNPYARVHPWGELPAPYEPGAYDARASFIGADAGPDGNIYLLSRCLQNSCTGRSEPALLKLDPSGRLLLSWGAGLFDFPHGMDLDDQGNVWVADQRAHRVVKFDAQGNQLLTIGQRGTAGAPPLLNEPTDVVVAPSGEVFITEGHSFAPGANRVTKYAADGTFLMSWGQTGSGAGEFNVPHTIALDSQGRVFVGDRGNNRIQVFDQQGTFLAVWYQFGRPSGIAIGADDRIYVADSESYGSDNPGWKKGIRVGSARDGSVQYLIEDLEPTAIEHSGAEGVGVDSNGNVYGAVVRRRMLERHEPNGSASPLPDGSAPAHLGHVAYAFPGAPDGRSLAATASAETGAMLLHANFAGGDLSDFGAMRRHAGHVLHLVEPADGVSGPGLGFGVIPAVEALVTHLERAAAESGASDNLRTHAGHVSQIAAGLVANARNAADLARQLADATSIRRAAPLVARLRALAYQITEGFDVDGDGRLSFDGEAGMQQLEAHLYLLLEGEALPRELRGN
jgi:sugar lactone lactonase YvrE